MDRFSPSQNEATTANGSLRSHELNEHVPTLVDRPGTTHSTVDDASVTKIRTENAVNHQTTEEASGTNLTTTVPSVPDAEPRTSTTIDTDQRSVSIYWSLRSFSASTLSLFNLSSGRPSQDGATWEGAIPITNNSGFGPAGTPRTMGNKGVREGRERGGFLPRLRGIGRTGKAPAPVPAGMLKALGVVKEDIEPVLPEARDHSLKDVLDLEESVRADLTAAKTMGTMVLDGSFFRYSYIDGMAQLQTEFDGLDSLSATDWNQTKFALSQLDNRYKSLLSIRVQIDRLRMECARLEMEEEERSKRDWDRLIGRRFADDTRRYEPEHIENAIRTDYETSRNRKAKLGIWANVFHDLSQPVGQTPRGTRSPRFEMAERRE